MTRIEIVARCWLAAVVVWSAGAAGLDPGSAPGVELSGAATGTAGSATGAAGSATGVAERPAAGAPGSDPTSGCLPVTGCHCQLPGSLLCQLSAAGELRAVAAHLASHPRLRLADLVLRGLAALPGGLFRGAALRGLMLSGSAADRLPADLLAGLEHSLVALGLGENRLTRVPTETLRPMARLERLDLSGNRLREVGAGSLPPLPRLVELNMADNQIVHLASGAFASLPALTTLDLQDSRLTWAQLRSGALQRLPRLRRLELGGNLLSGPLTPELTATLPRVRVLSLAHNNITSLGPGALASLPDLTSLDLSRNRIDVMAARSLTGLRRLETLRLDGNQMVTLPAGGFSGLKALSELDLSWNALQAVPADVLQPLTALRQLRLRGNDLIQLDGAPLTAMTRLKRLDLARNPLHCDCRLRDLAGYLAESRSRLGTGDLSQITCITPSRLENAPLMELTASQLTCSSPDLPAESPGPAPASDPGRGHEARVQLISAELAADGGGARLLWRVDPGLSPYRCRRLEATPLTATARRRDAERQAGARGPAEQEAECGDSSPSDPTRLSAELRAPGLRAGRRYRVCVTLEELTPTPALLPPVCEVTRLAPAPAPPLARLSAAVTAAGRVTARLTLAGAATPGCAVTVVVLGQHGPLAAAEAACARREVALWAAVGAGPARVCATDPYRAPAPLTTNQTRRLDPAAAARPPAPPLTRCVGVRPADSASWWPAAAAGLAALLAVGLLVGWTLARWRCCGCRPRCGGRDVARTRLASEDSQGSDTEDEETGLNA